MRVIRTFRDDFERICQNQSSRRVALDAKTGRVWTYGMLRAAVEGMGRTLWAAGIRPGDRVFSLLPNSIEQFVSFLAAWRLGIDFCPLSPLSTEVEACRLIRRFRCASGMVPTNVDPSLAGKLSDETAKRRLIPIALDGDVSRWMDAPPIRTPVDGPAAAGRLILFTSGTMADPKAMVLNADRLWSSAVSWVEHHSFLNADSRFYNVLPMSYLGGLFNLGLIPMACGGSFVISDAFSGLGALKFVREVRSFGVNVLWVSPTILRALGHLHKSSGGAPDAFKHVAAVFLGMSPISLFEKEQYEERFQIPLLENFALSETTFLSSEGLPSRAARTPGSVGQILPWVEIRLQPHDGMEGGSEIQVRTPFLFDGYWSGEGRVDLPLTADGFFPTGDLGSINDQGTLVIQGRIKDIVKKGGYLLVLRELEEVARTHPSIVDVAAVGVPHDFYGESAVVFVQLDADPAESRAVLEDVAGRMVARLAKFKWPDEIVSMSSFPKTPSGKIQKSLIREAFQSRRGIQDSVTLR